MASDATLSLCIELEPDSTPIDGRLIPPSGDVTHFHGWIELVAALNECLQSGPEGTQEGGRANGEEGE